MIKMVGVAVAFMSVCLVLFLGISMLDQVPSPETGTDEETIFEGLSDIVNISYKGFYAVLFVILLAMMVLGVAVMKNAL